MADEIYLGLGNETVALRADLRRHRARRAYTGVWRLLLICKALTLPPAALFEDFSASVLRRLSR